MLADCNPRAPNFCNQSCCCGWDDDVGCYANTMTWGKGVDRSLIGDA